MCRVALFLVGLWLSLVTGLSAQYYYLNGQKQKLNIDSSKILVQFESTVSPASYDSILEQYDEIARRIQSRYAIDGFQLCSLKSVDEYDESLNSLAGAWGISLMAPYYLIDDTLPFVIGETICCKFRSSIPKNIIDSLFSLYNLVHADTIGYDDNYYYLKITRQSPGNALEIANLLTESKLAEYALLFFHACRQRRISDI